MSGLHEAMVFQATLPNSMVREYSLAEYLAWRETYGIRVPDPEITDLISWMQAADNNIGRVGCWISVAQFRKAYPGHPAVTAFVDLMSRRSATLRGL